ncbi:hypothetical protein STAS_05745 [Striga asiatica]|uniref:SLH domain-containing protein n=1 Tax=Striga asiatica TaxID=4170 RepID=A0A5A7PAJ4_STRAF|nr:hypothetical protein STAS_05745 [Striga asiatica]
MCSTTSTLSLCLPSKIPFLSRHNLNFSFSVNPLCLRPRKPSYFSSVSEKNSSREVSWISLDKIAPDDYNGWAIAEYPPEPVKKRGLPTFMVFGVGGSLAAAIGLLAYFSLSRKGFEFRPKSPFSILHGFSVPYSTVTDDANSEEVIHDLLLEEAHIPKENMDDDILDSSVVTDKSSQTMKEQKSERIIIPIAADAAQQEALSALRTLKIIKDDVKADELCTRREYARWLVRVNSHLERSREHRLSTSSALSGSTSTAFDDVGIEDPDFESIQSLAEAGVVRSKLSDKNPVSNSNLGEEGFLFLPDRFISRQDLIGWKAKIEYKAMPGLNEEVSRKKVGFLDVKDISSDALPEIFVDTFADEKSIIRRVFGQSKRLQPNKPCTKGQAAVALTSGRMTEFLYKEISRLEAEYIARQIEIKELTTELIERGDIKQYWERKMEEEKNRGLEVEISYSEAISAFEQEKMFQENALAEIMRQKAALNCQEKLLSSLKAEIADMSEKLELEKENYVVEQVEVQNTRHDLQLKLEGLLDEKSILEAEIEALKILRSWVEDEAKKSQARAKLLEEAGRRWKWGS